MENRILTAITEVRTPAVRPDDAETARERTQHRDDARPDPIKPPDLHGLAGHTVSTRQRQMRTMAAS